MPSAGQSRLFGQARLAWIVAALFLLVATGAILGSGRRDGSRAFTFGHLTGAGISTLTKPQECFLPDGRWIAYSSDESGRYEVYVESFPERGGKRQISTTGGSGPRWRGDGKELYYQATDGKLMAAPVTDSANLAVGEPVALFEFRPNSSQNAPFYSVSRDGQRFLLSTIVETEAVESACNL